jgi:hypothetical protein
MNADQEYTRTRSGLTFTQKSVNTAVVSGFGTDLFDSYLQVEYASAVEGGSPMQHRVLPGFTLLVLLSALSSVALGQAAAESALTNSNSAAVGSKAGSAISKGLNQLNQKMSDQLSGATQSPGTQSPATQSSATQPPQRSTAQTSSRTTLLPPEHKRPMGISIQDSGKKCPGEHPESEEAANADPNQVYTVCSPHDTNKEHVPSLYKYDKVVDITF